VKDLRHDQRHAELREGMRAACAPFDSAYWQRIDEQRGYPEEFVQMLTLGGWLSALIPQEYGGSGLGLSEASVIMEEINRSGGNAGACHGQMYNMGTLLRHGSPEQKERWLPRIATGELRLQSMAVTEPGAGTDTTQIKTTAILRKSKSGDRYVINGQKVWISRVQHSDGMILLARTTPLAEVKRRTEGRLPLHPRWPECRANPHRRGMHRRCLLVHREGAALCLRPRGLQPADRQEPGRAVPAGAGLH
jgi:acyl-CoA dehydrogenase